MGGVERIQLNIAGNATGATYSGDYGYLIRVCAITGNRPEEA
jgi:hypothetical protein